MKRLLPDRSAVSKLRLRGRFGSLLCALGLTSMAFGADPTRTIAPDDQKIGYSDYVRLEFVPSPFDPAAKLARFDRILDMGGKGYRWNNPGARVRFRTDATTVKAQLYFNELHISTSARNSNGLYLIDGVNKPGEWRFKTKTVVPKRDTETVEVEMASGGSAGFHDYELILPYGDSADFQGLVVNDSARFETPRARPSTRYLAYGDSITHGFTASAVDKSYAWLVAEKNGWQIVNLGLGGRASNPKDAATVTSLKPDVISVFMGTNDWQGGVAPDKYRANMTAFLDGIRTAQPQTPIYLLTLLWIAPSWNPKSQVADTEAYRQVVREIVAARQDPNLHLVEGPDLIDHEAALFDSVAVHPNDKGFAQMAERLAARMRLPAK